MEASEADSFCCSRFFPILGRCIMNPKRGVIQAKAQWACWELKYSVLLRCWVRSWAEKTCQPPLCTLQVHLQSVQLTQLTKNQPAPLSGRYHFQLSPQISRCAFTYMLASYKMHNWSVILIWATDAPEHQHSRNECHLKGGMEKPHWASRARTLSYFDAITVHRMHRAQIFGLVMPAKNASKFVSFNRKIAFLIFLNLNIHASTSMPNYPLI